MKPLTEIRNGCGNIIIKEKYSIDCGGKVKDNWGIWNIIYCPICQALLEQAQEFEKKVEELKEDIKKLVYSGSDFYLDNVKLVLKEIDKIFSDNGDNSPATNPKKNIQMDIPQDTQTSDICICGHLSYNHRIGSYPRRYQKCKKCECKKFKPKGIIKNDNIVQGEKE